MRATLLLILLTVLFQGCMKKKVPVAVNGIAPLQGSPYFSISGSGPILADGAATSTISISIIDSNNIPIVGIVPRFSASNCRNENVYGACSATNDLGSSTCTLKSTCAETKTLYLTYPDNASGGTVVFTPGPKARVGFSNNTNTNVLLAANFSPGPEVQIQDTFGNLVNDTVDTIDLAAFTDGNCTNPSTGNLTATSLSLATDGSTGTVNFVNVQYDKWDNIYLKASSGGLLAACYGPIFVRQVIDPVASTITGTDNIVADGVTTSTIAIHLEDTLANPVVGVIPTYLATDTGSTNTYGACSATDGSGNSTCTLTSTKAEAKTLSVMAPILFSDGVVNFIAGAPNAALTTISGTTPIVADNTAQSDITITIKDLFGNPIVGNTPTFSVSGTGNTPTVCSASDALGISNCSVTSTVAEVKNLNLVNPVGKVGNDLTFVHGPVENVTYSTAPSVSAIATIALTTQPVVSLTDLNGNVITTSTSVSLGAFTDSGCSTSAGGNLTYSPASTVAGTATFSNVQYDTAGTIYLKAFVGFKSVCSSAIVVAPRPELTITGSVFNENSENIGATTGQIDISLAGDSFSGANSDDLFALGKVSITNVPVGLTPIVERLTATTAKLTLSGNAGAHANANDISNIIMTFADSAFTNSAAAIILNNETTGISVDFIDPYTMTYDTATFTEDIANDGSISNSLVLTLTGSTFTGVNSDDLFAQGKITVNNLPVGLTLQAIKNSDTQATLSLTGNASSHSTDITNLEFVFLDTAYNTGKATGVVGATKSDIIIDNLPPATLSYDVAAYNEAALNDGSVTDVIVVTLANDTFVADPTGTFSAVGVPAGLTLIATRDSDTQLTFSLTGNATSHLNADDTAITFEFLATAFTNNSVAANVVNYQNTFNVDFIDPPVLTYANAIVTERGSNDGGIDETIVINLTGDIFAADPTGTITVNNLPAGLSTVITRNSDTQLAVGFTGVAIGHLNSDDIANLEFIFTGAAFEGVSDPTLVENYTNSALSIDFNDPPGLSYDVTTFNEDVSNTGATSTELTITLVGDEFSTALDSKININGVPAGLSSVITRDSATQIRISLSGNAVAHELANSVANMQITFLDTAFVNATSATDVTGYTRSDVAVNFIDAASLTYDVTTVNEVALNDGSITEKMTVTLTNDTFDADLTGDITAGNVPVGLTLAINRVSATVVELSFIGSALAHANSDDVGDLTITFLANAFVGNTVAANVTGFELTDGIINFNDPASLNYSATTFTESSDNTGATTDSIIITLNGDTFASSIAGKITATNVPVGLTASFAKTSATQVTMTLTGNATNHESGDSVTNLGITFNDGVFVNNATASNVVNYSVIDRAVIFSDSASLAYSGTTFTENLDNTGATSDSLVITLTGDTFVADLTGKITPANVPVGMTAVFTRDSATQVTMTVTGNAGAHESANDVADLTVTFDATAFTNNTIAANVVNYEVTDRVIDFSDKASLAYSSTTFNESLDNDGTSSDTLIITLTGDSFVADLTGKISSLNVPLGMTLSFVRDSATQVTASLAGSAFSHESLNDVADLTITFDATAFTNNTVAANVTNYEITNGVIDFIDTASLAYSVGTYTESTNNDGTIGNTIVIDLTNDTFAADMTGKVSVTNVPTGLSASVVRNSGTQVEVSLTGSASSHDNADDIANLTIAFIDSAFVNTALATNVVGNSKSDVIVDFADQASLAYDVTDFAEVVGNDGSISNSIILTLTNDTFVADLTGLVTASGVPAGLSFSFVRDSGTQVTVSLTGNATSHESGDDTSVTISFADGSFTNTAVAANVVDYSKVATVSYLDGASLAYSGTTFTEGAANVGSTSDSLVITLTNDTFVADLTGKITPANVPVGMAAVFTRDSATQVTMTLTGSAGAHENANDVANLTVTFDATAFTNNTVAANVTNYEVTDRVIDFIDKASLAYSGTTFTESAGNGGSTSDSLVITLTGDTFAADLSGKITTTNLPASMTAIYTRDSATQVTMTLGGSADAHESANDVVNLTVTFDASAFVNNTVAANVTNYEVADRVIDFNDTASLAYSVGTFTESTSNDGSMGNTIVIDLTNDTFALSMAGKIIFTNIPSGLTPSIARNSNTQVEISLTGNANSHLNINDASNIGFSFSDSAFVNTSSATDVTNYSKNDIAVDYSDQPSLSYSSTSFQENAANDGTFTTSLVVTLTGDTFIADLTGLITASSVPAGTAFSFVRNSANQATLSLTGNATSHEVVDDTNFTVSFADGAFSNTTLASNVITYQQLVDVQFRNKATLTYTGTLFLEDSSNTGTISNSVIINLTNDSFVLDITGKVIATNVPAGLTANFNRLSATQISMNLTGSATNHESVNDISNLTVTFSSNIFIDNTVAANVTNYEVSNLQVDFSDKASLSYSGTTFNESSANNGTTSDSLIITLTNDTFVADLTSKVVATNLPVGMSAVFTRDTDTQVTMTLSGTATSHENANDVANLTVTFDATAFTNNTDAANVTNYIVNDRVVNFLDSAALSYSTVIFTEDSVNDGSISNSIVIDLINDTFAASMIGKIAITNVPAGLSSAIVRNSDTQVTVSLTGNATSHDTTNDISNLNIVFADSAFVNTSLASNVVNADRNDIAVDFNDQPTLSYSATVFSEATINNGSISNSIILTLSGDTFAANLAGLITASSTPAGLTFSFARNSDTQVTLSLTGSATDHTSADNSSFTVNFADGAFVTTTSADNVTDYSKSVSLSFLDQPALSYSGNTFNESVANDGTISNTLTISLSGDIFSIGAATNVTVNNIPVGLVKSVTRTSSTTMDITFTGNATAHENINDISNLEIVFADATFTNTSLAANVTNSTVSNLVIDFNNKPVLTYSTRALTESVNNDGSIDDSIIIALTGDTFTAGVTSEVSLSNLPLGLTANIARDSSSQLTITFLSTATSHLSTDDISNVGIAFTNNAFTNVTNISNVQDSSIADVSISFIDPALLSYSSSTFTEDVSNDGSIGNSITVTLTGDTFPADLTGDIQITNVPAGLTAGVTRNSATEIVIDLSGNATSHGNTDDIGNLTVAFLDNAFTNNTDAANVTNYLKTDISVDFSDTKSLSYSSLTFNEVETKLYDSNTLSVFSFEKIKTTGVFVDQATPTNSLEDSSANVELSSSYHFEAGSLYVNDSSMETGLTSLYALDGDFTVELWSYIPDLSTQSSHPLLAMTENINNRFMISVGSFGEIFLDGDSTQISSSAGIFTQAQWNHIALVVDQSQARWRIYLNGTSVIEGDLSADWNNSDHNLVLGEDIFNTGNYDGYIDELRISDIARYTANFTPSSSAFGTPSYVGSIGPEVLVTAEGVTFSGSVDDDFVIDSKVIVSNFPAGLNPVVRRISDSEVTISFEGQATDHLNADDLSNLSIEFLDSSFTGSENALDISGYIQSSLSVDFID